MMMTRDEDDSKWQYLSTGGDEDDNNEEFLNFISKERSFVF